MFTKGLSPLGELWRILTQMLNGEGVKMGEFWQILAKSFLARQKRFAKIRQCRSILTGLVRREVNFYSLCVCIGEKRRKPIPIELSPKFAEIRRNSPEFAQWG